MTRMLLTNKKNQKGGLTYIETILGIAIFVMVAGSLFITYQKVFQLVRLSQSRVTAVALANEQFEIVRNLPYAQVGTFGGIPSGVIPPVQTLTRAGMTFIATTTVRNVDLPFDGVAGGMPNDLSPADNKSVEIDIMCVTCNNFRPMILTTTVGPKGLENASTNGSLFIQALDAGGLPIAGANVYVHNSSTTPVVDINDITSTSGMLQLIDAPPATTSYQITVSKTGYSTDQTYGAPTTTNPVKPHATVAVQTVTQLSFAIDRLATLNVSSVTPVCNPVANIGVELTGSKLIATSPNVLKYDQWFSTGASGLQTLNNIEWDSYTIAASSTTYDLAGIVPLSPLAIAPGATQNVQLVMVPKNPLAVVVTVKDAGTGLPVTGATVTLDNGVASMTQTTGRGFLRQTDWSGGSGQDMFIDPTRYSADDDNIDVTTYPGEVRLKNTFGSYAATGNLTSSTFDTGSASNFYQFTYLPTSQPVAAGASSVQFQLATGNSTTSWTYLGPDGTPGTYYTATTTDINTLNNGRRYLRYKMYLSTASSTLTPNVSDAMFTYTSSCVPPGQVIFQGLSSGTWNITVSKSGYTTAYDTVTASSTVPWQEKSVTIGP